MNTEKLVATLLLLDCYVYACIFALFYSHQIEFFGWQYIFHFFVPKAVPIAVFAVYLLTHNPLESLQHKVFSVVSWGVFGFVAAGLAVVASAYAVDFPLTFFLGNIFRWSYVPIIEWAATFLLVFWGVWHVLKNSVTALAFATVSVSAGGMLYELCLYHYIRHTSIYFDATFPLFVATQWVSLAFLFYMLYRYRFKLSFLSFMAFWMFFAFSCAYAFNPFLFNEWIPRVPTIILLTFLPFGFKQTEKS